MLSRRPGNHINHTAGSVGMQMTRKINVIIVDTLDCPIHWGAKLRCGNCFVALVQ
jgi:hypothetical protein